jgi:hypothetical protein
MSVILNQNQFAITSQLGAPDLAYNFNTKTVQINPASIGTFQVATAVKLIAGAVPSILVDVAAASDAIYGVIWNSLKKNVNLAPGKFVEIACKGSVIYLEAAAAINRGALVEYVAAGPDGPEVQTKALGTTLGRAIDQASGAGALIRVEIDPAATA